MNEPRPSYEDMLSLVRGTLVAEPGRPDSEAFELALRQAVRVSDRRSWIAAGALLLVVAVWLLSLALHPIPAALCEHLGRRDVFEIGLLPALNVIVCLVLLRRPGAAAAMFVRACCWSYLVLGALCTYATPGLLPWLFPAAAVGCGAALLALGERGLQPEHYRGVFQPIAHRAALTWTMVLAVADMQTLLAVNQANVWHHPIDAVCAVAMIVAVIGLYRMRLWGLLANLAVNVAIGTLAATGNLIGVPEPLTYVLMATAAAQVGLVVPLLRSLWRGSVREYSQLRRAGAVIGRIVVVALMAAAVAGAVRGPDPMHMQTYCEAQSIGASSPEP